ncbi:hypothetical protein PSCLAVI8L_130424 [Pseudoclavibacter sp. 8L]|nr:hypothetical protein PSCLAVI8L_130424 [Pseudoclavibacter sp. 8L]
MHAATCARERWPPPIQIGTEPGVSVGLLTFVVAMPGLKLFWLPARPLPSDSARAEDRSC